MDNDFRPTHFDLNNIEWYDTGEVGYRLVLDYTRYTSPAERALMGEITFLRAELDAMKEMQ